MQPKVGNRHVSDSDQAVSIDPFAGGHAQGDDCEGMTGSYMRARRLLHPHRDPKRLANRQHRADA